MKPVTRTRTLARQPCATRVHASAPGTTLGAGFRRRAPTGAPWRVRLALSFVAVALGGFGLHQLALNIADPVKFSHHSASVQAGATATQSGIAHTDREMSSPAVDRLTVERASHGGDAHVAVAAACLAALVVLAGAVRMRPPRRHWLLVRRRRPRRPRPAGAGQPRRTALTLTELSLSRT